MFSDKWIKGSILASWALMIMAVTPLGTQATAILAGLSLVLSYCLGILVHGATNNEAMDAMRSFVSEQKSLLESRTIAMDQARFKTEEATNRVGKAISELRQDGLR